VCPFGTSWSNPKMLLRLNVLESKNGICLFEKIWKWSGVSNAQAICKLVLTFHQISREIGGASSSVQQVLFDQPSLSTLGKVGILSEKDKESIASIGGTGTGGYRTATNATRILGSVKTQRNTKEEQSSIRLACSRSTHIIVALFHEWTVDLAIVQQLTDNILKVFKSKYGQKVKEMKKIFEEIEEQTNSSQMSTKDVMEIFKGFLDDAETLRKEFNECLEKTMKKSKEEMNSHEIFSKDEESTKLIDVVQITGT